MQIDEIAAAIIVRSVDHHPALACCVGCAALTPIVEGRKLPVQPLVGRLSGVDRGAYGNHDGSTAFRNRPFCAA